MYKRLISILILLCFSYQSAFPIVVDNFSHIERLSAQACDKIVNFVKSENTKILSVKIAEHSSANYFEQILTNTLSKNLLLSVDSASSKLELNIIQNNVYYNLISSSSDSLARNFKTELKYTLRFNDNRIKSDFCTFNYSDTVANKDIEWLERAEMPFAKSPIPTNGSTWLSDIIAPAIVFSSALLTVFMLFSVRSK